jgi:signal transduction histidine kinase
VSVPLLREYSVVVHLLGFDPAQQAAEPGLVWFRATVMAVSLLTVMILLERFHRLLLDAVTQRIAVQQKVEAEMYERQRLEREIAAIGDGERRRLGQELHDGVCQQLTAALLRCQAMERRLDKGGALSGADFAPLSSLLAETINDAHDVASGLCPLEPVPDALAPALRALTKRMQQMAAVRCEFHAAGDVHLDDPEVAKHLYRVAQEALSNAARHAKANRIAVELRVKDGELTLQIEDDGSGLPADVRGGGMGLRTMACRSQMMSGKLTVEPAPGGGTRITCCVPISVSAQGAGHPA